MTATDGPGLLLVTAPPTKAAGALLRDAVREAEAAGGGGGVWLDEGDAD